MVGNSQVIFEKAESSSLTLVGEFLNWAQFHPGAVLINGWEVICAALQTKSTVGVHFPGAWTSIKIKKKDIYILHMMAVGARYSVIFFLLSATVLFSIGIFFSRKLLVLLSHNGFPVLRIIQILFLEQR